MQAGRWLVRWWPAGSRAPRGARTWPAEALPPLAPGPGAPVKKREFVVRHFEAAPSYKERDFRVRWPHRPCTAPSPTPAAPTTTDTAAAKVASAGAATRAEPTKEAAPDTAAAAKVASIEANARAEPSAETATKPEPATATPRATSMAEAAAAAAGATETATVVNDRRDRHRTLSTTTVADRGTKPPTTTAAAAAAPTATGPCGPTDNLPSSGAGTPVPALEQRTPSTASSRSASPGCSSASSDAPVNPCDFVFDLVEEYPGIGEAEAVQLGRVNGFEQGEIVSAIGNWRWLGVFEVLGQGIRVAPDLSSWSGRE
mmetsp:Transcript_116702/g.362600  ORF Transcript_116702/g.362600 Transcript_116702/m.362600 type:complete len:315 (-) Transcript_116702:209-1153(-)